MASAVTKWTRMGSNTASAAAATNIPENQGDFLLEKTMRYECSVWLDGTGAVTTEPFDWPVNGDFTVIVNALKLNFDTDPGNTTIKVEGSVTGLSTDWVELDSMGTSFTIDNNIAHDNYDIDSDGKMPYMRISIDPTNDPNAHDEEGMKVVVVMI